MPTKTCTQMFIAALSITAKIWGWGCLHCLLYHTPVFFPNTPSSHKIFVVNSTLLNYSQHTTECTDLKCTQLNECRQMYTFVENHHSHQDNIEKSCNSMTLFIPLLPLCSIFHIFYFYILIIFALKNQKSLF